MGEIRNAVAGASEKFMKDLMAKKAPVRSTLSVINVAQGKAWCVWETDTIERLEGIMVEFPYIHTDIVPVKLAPQIMEKPSGRHNRKSCWVGKRGKAEPPEGLLFSCESCTTLVP